MTMIYYLAFQAQQHTQDNCRTKEMTITYYLAFQAQQHTQDNCIVIILV